MTGAAGLPPFKKPIPLAPAPARFGASRLGAPIMEADGLSSEDSDDEIVLVARSTTPRAGGMYAELEGFEADDTVDGEEEELIPEEEETADRDEMIRARVATSQEQMRGILASLTPEQLQRYETFRRVGFPRPMVKKIMQRVVENLGGGNKDKASANINPSAIIVVAGITKVFVGELVEEARAVLEEWGDDPANAITPAHVLEAHRRLKKTNAAPMSINHRRRNPVL